MSEGGEGTVAPQPVIKEVTNTELGQRVMPKVESSLQRLSSARSSRESTDLRRQMLGELGSQGEGPIRSIIGSKPEAGITEPKSTLFTEFITEPARYKEQYLDFALINDAVATSSPEDIDRSLDALDALKDDSALKGEAFSLSTHEARKQLCRTLVRQIDQLIGDTGVAQNPDGTNDIKRTNIDIKTRLEGLGSDKRAELRRIRERLNTIRGDQTTNDSIKSRVYLGLPLYLAGDEGVWQELGPDHHSENAYIGQWKTKQFNLEKFDYDDIRQTQKDSSRYINSETGEQTNQEPIVIRRSSQERQQPDEQGITNEEPAPLQAPEQETHKRMSIDSEKSPYKSPLKYKVRDVEALWDALESGQFTDVMRHFYQRHGRQRPAGPDVLGHYPTMNYDKGILKLTLPVQVDEQHGFTKSFTPTVIGTFKSLRGGEAVRDNMEWKDEDGERKLVATQPDKLMPEFHNQLAELAARKGRRITINVHNMLPDVRSGLHSAEDLRIALTNALEFHRILVTELANEENQRRKELGEQVLDLPEDTVIIDSEYNIPQSSPRPLAA
jgi:hypothetical protein